MSTSLGWRDVGTVLLSKADAERRKGDERRGEDGRAVPVFEGAVMSRRQHRQKPVDKGPIEEVPALVMDLHTVTEKKPESRLKWLQKALLGAGKNQIKVSDVFDLVTHKKFLTDVRSGVGSQMKAMLLANLHLFSSRQQKLLESDASPFGEFPTAAPASLRGEVRQSSGTARHDAEKRDLERRDLERRDLERRDLERRDLERRDLERRDLERRDAERRDAERRDAERRDAERREVERHEFDEPDFSGKRRRTSTASGRRRDSSEDDMSRRKDAVSTSRPPAEGSRGRVDPRIYSRGAADEPSD